MNMILHRRYLGFFATIDKQCVYNNFETSVVVLPRRNSIWTNLKVLSTARIGNAPSDKSMTSKFTILPSDCGMILLDNYNQHDAVLVQQLMQMKVRNVSIKLFAAIDESTCDKTLCMRQMSTGVYCTIMKISKVMASSLLQSTSTCSNYVIVLIRLLDNTVNPFMFIVLYDHQVSNIIDDIYRMLPVKCAYTDSFNEVISVRR